MNSTTAQLLTQRLEQYGVSCVFGIPGVHTLELYRALQSSTIQHVTPRHEQGAGFMADGFARVSGEPGVCFIITGPGMTNIVTAMGQAYSESIPMLVISSVNSHGHMGSGEGWLHELPDQRALVSGVCAFSHTVHHPDEIDQVLARAFAVFDSQRPRPVHIEIPINVLKTVCATNNSNHNTTPDTNTSATLPKALRLMPPAANPDMVYEAALKVHHAKSPVILLGGGATSASQMIDMLAIRMDAPVIMSVNARGVLPYDHPLSVSATASSKAVRSLIKSSDVVLGLGCELGPTDYDFMEDGDFSIPGTFIRVDIDAQQLVRSEMPQLGLVGDSLTTAKQLLQALQALETDAEQIKPTNDKTGALRARTTNALSFNEMSSRNQCYLKTLETIRDTLPQVIIVGDSTQIIYAGNCALGMSRPASYFNSAMGFGTLGYALPAAIGAAIADQERTIVAISGDGGLQFCLAEFATAIDQQLRIILIVHENGGYHEIDQSMQADGIEPLGVKINVPDLAAIASSFGWQFNRPASLQDLPAILRGTLVDSKPTMIVLNDRLFPVDE